MSAEIVRFSDLQARRLASQLGETGERITALVPLESIGYNGFLLCRAGIKSNFHIKDTLPASDQLRTLRLLEQCHTDYAEAVRPGTDFIFWVNSDWQIEPRMRPSKISPIPITSPGQLIKFKKKEA